METTDSHQTSFVLGVLSENSTLGIEIPDIGIQIVHYSDAWYKE